MKTTYNLKYFGPTNIINPEGLYFFFDCINYLRWYIAPLPSELCLVTNNIYMALAASIDRIETERLGGRDGITKTIVYLTDVEVINKNTSLLPVENKLQ